MGHALAHGFDHASSLHAQLHGQVHRVQTATLINVDVIEADRVVANAHFARARFTDRDVHQMHVLGAAVLVDLDRTGH